jgi:hypothetical protein
MTDFQNTNPPGFGGVESSAIRHGHYKKDVRHLKMVDIYRVLELWEVTSPPLQHALKKVLAAGKRGAKNEEKDVQEAIDSLRRWQDMRAEDARKLRA